MKEKLSGLKKPLAGVMAALTVFGAMVFMDKSWSDALLMASPWLALLGVEGGLDLVRSLVGKVADK